MPVRAAARRRDRGHRLYRAPRDLLRTWHATSARYARAAWQLLERCSRNCAWIVDLRSDSGGDLWPMFAAVEPLLSTSRPVGVRSRTGFEGWFTVTGGTVSQAGARFSYGNPPEPIKGRIAILTGFGTFSSGEWTTLALLSGPRTARIFGEPTGGGPTSPMTFRLPDGARVRMAVAAAVTPNGQEHLGPIAPDVPMLSVGTAVVDAARRWLEGGA